MTSRRDVVGLAVGGLIGLTLQPEWARAATIASEDDALEALDAWLDAVYTGDPAVVEKVLAPEFQVLRSNGVGHSKVGYLGELPKQNMRSRASEITATGHEAILVIRYNLETEQTIDGIAVSGTSPRLSVFRKENGQWLIISHANFAPLD